MGIPSHHFGVEKEVTILDEETGKYGSSGRVALKTESNFRSQVGCDRGKVRTKPGVKYLVDRAFGGVCNANFRRRDFILRATGISLKDLKREGSDRIKMNASI